MSKVPVVIQVLMFVLILLCGNLSWKVGLDKMGGFMIEGKTTIESFIDIVFSYWIWLGAFFYITGTLLWFYIISKEELSYVYPMVSIGYILTAVMGVILFNEHVSLTRWIGMGVVSSGFILLSFK